MAPSAYAVPDNGGSPGGSTTTTTTSPERRTPTAEVNAGRNFDALQYLLSGTDDESQPEPKATGQAGTSSRRVGKTAPKGPPPPPRYAAYKPVLKQGPAGGLCIGEERKWYLDKETAIFINQEQEQRWLRLDNYYDFCPGVTRPGSASPAGVAVDYWREYGEELLPRPQPVIRPGWMLAGKPGYLEANVPLSATFPHDTRLGRLTIDVRGELFVDWGDGHDGGPFDQAGAPWPDGTITHVWTHAGRYDVVATVRWVATWRLGDDGGRLTDLVTEGLIEDFEIRGLEAIRNR